MLSQEAIDDIKVGDKVTYRRDNLNWIIHNIRSKEIEGIEVKQYRLNCNGHLTKWMQKEEFKTTLKQ